MKMDCIVTVDEDGVYCASVPALPGCHTDGRTLAELQANIADAVGLYLQDIVAEAAEKARASGASLRSFSFSITPKPTAARRRMALA
ncbi:MAG: type II toxin-antitoxin system HicB family antitoxin [Kiritimatiellae bacterium]|nr:type II toxin-antitoxin system HicB family antitoxin [Kiritimatiellia bacterium]